MHWWIKFKATVNHIYFDFMLTLQTKMGEGHLHLRLWFPTITNSLLYLIGLTEQICAFNSAYGLKVLLNYPRNVPHIHPMDYMIIANGLLVQYGVYSLLKLLIVGAHDPIFTVFVTAGKHLRDNFSSLNETRPSLSGLKYVRKVNNNVWQSVMTWLKYCVFSRSWC